MISQRIKAQIPEWQSIEVFELSAKASEKAAVKSEIWKECYAGIKSVLAKDREKLYLKIDWNKVNGVIVDINEITTVSEAYAKAASSKEEIITIELISDKGQKIIFSAMDETVKSIGKMLFNSDCELIWFRCLESQMRLQNKIFEIDMLKLQAFHEKHKLNELSDRELVAFCSDTKKMQEYVLLGGRFKDQAMRAVKLNLVLSESVNDISAMLKQAFTLKAQFLSVRENIDSKAQKLTPIEAWLLKAIKRPVDDYISVLEEWTTDGKTPSEKFKKSHQDALDSLNQFKKSQAEVTKLLLRFDHICNVRKKLLQLAAAKKEAAAASQQPSAPISIPAPQGGRARLMPPPVAAPGVNGHTSSTSTTLRNVSPPK